MKHVVDERTVDALLALAAEWSGYQIEGVARQAVRRALERELAAGTTIVEVMKRAAAKDPELVKRLRAAVGVRETFFFRHPEQFNLVAAHVPELAANGGVVRAWSAGCASGEETWSLTATLAAALAGHETGGAPRIAVLGSDVYEPGLEVARAGVYRTASIRASGPLLFPVVTMHRDRVEVLEPLRPMTTFVAHDLRDEEPGQFEIIFCRNVLIYFSPASIRQIVANLTRALAPGGLLLFGTMDVDPSDVPGLVRVGRPELMTFMHAPTRRRKKPTTRLPRTKSPTLPPEPVSLHRSALVWIELGGRGGAEKVLMDLNHRYPEYLPGLLERALFHVRKGEHDTAATWMKQVFERALAMPEDAIVPGLEALPASFYRDAAAAYLDRGGTWGQDPRGGGT